MGPQKSDTIKQKMTPQNEDMSAGRKKRPQMEPEKIDRWWQKLIQGQWHSLKGGAMEKLKAEMKIIACVRAECRV